MRPLVEADVIDWGTRSMVPYPLEARGRRAPWSIATLPITDVGEPFPESVGLGRFFAPSLWRAGQPPAFLDSRSRIVPLLERAGWTGPARSSGEPTGFFPVQPSWLPGVPPTSRPAGAPVPGVSPSIVPPVSGPGLTEAFDVGPSGPAAGAGDAGAVAAGLAEAGGTAAGSMTPGELSIPGLNIGLGPLGIGLGALGTIGMNVNIPGVGRVGIPGLGINPISMMVSQAAPALAAFGLPLSMQTVGRMAETLAAKMGIPTTSQAIQSIVAPGVRAAMVAGQLPGAAGMMTPDEVAQEIADAAAQVAATGIAPVSLQAAAQLSMQATNMGQPSNVFSDPQSPTGFSLVGPNVTNFGRVAAPEEEVTPEAGEVSLTPEDIEAAIGALGPPDVGTPAAPSPTPADVAVAEAATGGGPAPAPPDVGVPSGEVATADVGGPGPGPGPGPGEAAAAAAAVGEGGVDTGGDGGGGGGTVLCTWAAGDDPDLLAKARLFDHWAQANIPRRILVEYRRAAKKILEGLSGRLHLTSWLRAEARHSMERAHRGDPAGASLHVAHIVTLVMRSLGLEIPTLQRSRSRACTENP